MKLGNYVKKIKVEYWKDEERNIIFYISEDITIYFDNSIKSFLYSVDNVQEIYDRDMGNHHFIMTDKTLSCTDCKDEENEEEEDSNDESSKANITS